MQVSRFADLLPSPATSDGEIDFSGLSSSWRQSDWTGSNFRSSTKHVQEEEARPRLFTIAHLGVGRGDN